MGYSLSIDSSENNDVIIMSEPCNPVQYSEAMALTVDRINSNKNILPGVTLAYEIQDTCLDSNCALEQTSNFVVADEILLIMSQERVVKVQLVYLV